MSVYLVFLVFIVSVVTAECGQSSMLISACVTSVVLTNRYQSNFIVSPDHCVLSVKRVQSVPCVLVPIVTAPHTVWAITDAQRLCC